jgi:hypothetical protein
MTKVNDRKKFLWDIKYLYKIRKSCLTAVRNVETDSENKELRNNIRQSEVFSIKTMDER